MSASPTHKVPVGGVAVSRLWLLDALRFPAALGVVAFHVLLSVRVQRPAGDGTTWWLGWLNYGGVLGVSLFFGLSGFGVHLGRARARAAGRETPFAPAEFARRRFWRLYPAYLAALALSVLLGIGWALWRGRDPAGALPSPGNLLAHLLLVHPLFPATNFGIVPAFWFVGVLAHLLLLYLLYLKAAARWGDGRALLGVLAVTLVYRGAVFALVGPGEARTVWLANAPGRWFEWALGAWLATMVANGRSLPWPAGAAALALVPVWLAFGEGTVTFYEPVLGALLTVALWWGLTVTAASTPRRLPAGLGWAGNASYATYLLHQIFIPYVSSALSARPLASAALFGGVLLLVLAVTLPLAGALHRWVESPLTASPKT